MDTTAQLAKWRHLIESELLECATPLTWADLQAMTCTVYERSASVMVTTSPFIGGEKVINILVVCGELEEARSMVQEMEACASQDGIRRIMFIGRRGWLRAFPAYREIAVIGERVV